MTVAVVVIVFVFVFVFVVALRRVGRSIQALAARASRLEEDPAVGRRLSCDVEVLGAALVDLRLAHRRGLDGLYEQIQRAGDARRSLALALGALEARVDGRLVELSLDLAGAEEAVDALERGALAVEGWIAAAYARGGFPWEAAGASPWEDTESSGRRG